MTRVLCLASMVTSLFAIVGISSAATVQYTLNWGPLTVPSANTNVGQLPKFDPTLGTLTMVTLDLDATTSGGTIVFDNESEGSGSVNLSVGATVTGTTSLGGVSTLIATPLQLGSGPVGPDDDGSPDFTGADSYSTVSPSGNDSDTQSSTSPPVLASYTGIASFFDVFIDPDFLFGATGNVSGQTQQAGGTTEGSVVVTYEYNESAAVPEPSSLILAATGLLGLWLACSRRHSSRHR